MRGTSEVSAIREEAGAGRTAAWFVVRIVTVPRPATWAATLTPPGSSTAAVAEPANIVEPGTNG